MPETCRVSCRSKFGKLVHLVGFIIKQRRIIYRLTMSKCGIGKEAWSHAQQMQPIFSCVQKHRTVYSNHILQCSYIPLEAMAAFLDITKTSDRVNKKLTIILFMHFTWFRAESVFCLVNVTPTTWETQT